MEIVGKEYRNIKPILSKGEDDVQGTIFSYEKLIYIYIYDERIVSSAFNHADDSNINEFGVIPKKVLKMRRDNINKRIEKENDDSIGKYFVDDNKIRIEWKPLYDKINVITFEGSILLNGDAIKGKFYKNNIELEPERLYFNINKPLPKELIRESDNDV